MSDEQTELTPEDIAKLSDEYTKAFLAFMPNIGSVNVEFDTEETMFKVTWGNKACVFNCTARDLWDYTRSLEAAKISSDTLTAAVLKRSS